MRLRSFLCVAARHFKQKRSPQHVQVSGALAKEYFNSEVFMRNIILIFAILVSGCSSTPVKYMVAKEPRVPWPVEEYAKIDDWSGANIVKGQAFLKTRGGDVKVAAGNEVYLNPVTSYSTQFVDAIIYKKHGVGVVLVPETPDPRIHDYVKTTVADSDGRFTFHDVKSGDYYLYSTVTWEAPVGYQGALSMQGGWVLQKVTVSENSRNNFILNGIK